MTTLEKVTAIIAEQLDKPTSDVPSLALIQEELGANSLDKVEMIIKFEEAFRIEIHDPEAMKIKTVADAVTAIEGKVALLEVGDALSL